jgi:ferredoxin-thioredoxin reductase catalytic subunit/rhodanese-related sulfurtransferase
MSSIDINSKEFMDEFNKTEEFANRVNNQFKWTFNPDQGVVDRILKGLTNNKLLHGKRYCPCFVPQFTKEDRICPCKPAIENEIPNDGVCHCGIFCTPEYAENCSSKETKTVDTIDGFTKNEIESILLKTQLGGEELQILLKAREAGMVSFKLVDIREQFEWDMGRIAGADFLVPTSDFYNKLAPVMPYKDEPIILYCHVGSRSAYVQRVLTQGGDFSHIGNLTYGIAAYGGDIVR